jgi:outer membrane protein assembly factor BamB
MRALDPHTGAVRWTSPRWRFAHPVGEFALAFEYPRWWATWTGPAFVVDPATGRLVGDLGTWMLIEGSDDSAPMVGVRRIAGGRLMVAVLKAAGPEVLGIIDESPGDCVRQTGAIICRRFDGSQAVLLVSDEHRAR